MQEMNTNNFGMTSDLVGLDIPEAEERGRVCLSDNCNGQKRKNLMELDKNGDALDGGYGDYSENKDDAYEIYEDKWKNLGGDAEAGGVSTFVEIPMAGVDRGKGRNLQITGYQVSVGKGGTMPSSDQAKCSRTGCIGYRNAEMVIQVGGINLVINRGVQEATLRIVMKVVMDYA